MSSTKAALKAAKAALDGQKYEEAASQTRTVLDADPKNYHANVFLGLALDKLEKYEESEKAYQAAAAAKADDALVWQGLISLFEKQGGKKLDDYADVVRNLARIYANVDDRHKCQSVVDKYVGFAKQHGSRRQLRQAYDIMVPGSPVYDCLEGRVLKPEVVYMRIAELVEADEKEQISKLIAERRTRLGARIGQVTADVKREIYTSSDIEGLYQGIIDYTHDDELRRQYEEKLLQRAYDVLSILPASDKAMKLPHVQKLAEGMVIIKAPCALAWQIVLEWRDVEKMEEWDVSLLRQYIELFPEDGLTKVLRGFLGSDISPFPEPVAQKSENTDGEKAEELEPLTAEDRLTFMTEGLEESSRSVLSQRMMCEYYLFLEEYASTVDQSRKAVDLIKQEQKLTGLTFQNRLDGANIVLATSLIHHQSPRHHREAREIFDNIVARKSTSVSALIGIGMIMEEDEDFEGATQFLSRAWKENPTVKVRSEAAWCKARTGGHAEALPELEACLQDLEVVDEKDKSLKAELLYRIGQCLWDADTSKAARKDRNGAYARWLQCLQININYAPAYTSLGIYYSDYAKDRKRARKCFQKAFELSPSEVYAAERLARAFADSKDWDSVETVAQRVKDSSRIRPPPGSKKKAISWPYAALGVCHLNNQNFALAVPEFNAALRINPGDYHSLVGLGESYHNLGRFIAATRAFEEARKYEDSVPESDTWFCRYMLANVHRDLGEFEEAVEAYEEVLKQRPSEFGVSVALLQTFVEQAWHCTTLGLFGRAAQSLRKAIELAAGVVDQKAEAFNLWKALGEACSMYATLGDYVKDIPVDQLRKALETGADGSMYSILTDIDNINLDTITQPTPDSNTHSFTTLALHAGILAYKRGIAASSKDIHAQAVSWYNLGWTSYQAHTHLTSSTTTHSPDSKARTSNYLKASVRSFKRAIELEARNAEFWNAMGIVTTTLNAKVAQHSFARSLYLNDKSAQTWTNLGVLYLLENDIGLAREAFTRGQSADPGYAHAWIGQGLLALLAGEREEARAMFTHAFEIADSSSVIAKKLYATSAFDHIVKEPKALDIADLLQPLFALHQLRTQAASNIEFYHLSSLFSERIGSHSESIESLEKVTSAVEAEYEQSEDPDVLTRFAQAQADLARAYLASEDYDNAIEHATTALDLSAEEESGARDQDARTKYRLSAHLTAGLAHARQGQADDSIGMFRAALTESAGNPDVVCLLAQVLWAKGSTNERDVAREQLLDSVEKYPEHAGSIILLAVIALLDDDKETLEAIASDLQSLRTQASTTEHDLLRISTVLKALAQLQPGLISTEPEIAEQAEAASSVMLAPAKPYGWASLSSVSDDPYAAEMAMLTAGGSVPPKGTLNAEELAKMQAATHRVADAQRAIMLAPWVAAGWTEFSEGVKVLDD